MRLLRIAADLLLGPPLFLLALACAAAALLAHGGRVSLTLDILSHFAPLWLAGALAAVALAGLALQAVWRRTVLVIGLVGALAAGALIAPELLRSTGPKAAPDAPGRLKIIQFNVWNQNRDYDQTAAWIARENPDVAVLVEASGELRRRLRAALPGWHVGGRGEVILLSRRAPVSQFYIPVGKHRVAPLAGAAFADDRGAYTVVGVHNAWPTDIADQQRQEARLAKVLAGLPRASTIVSGDFNSTPWAFSRQRWDRAFGLIRRDQAVFTWPAEDRRSHRIRAPLPFLPIDHVYAGPDWATVSVRRGPRLGSDHYPVVVILAPVAPR
jgi:endonuclease/exonuclease/phosphatase (EEP) superfamily protein YafD